MYNRLKNLLSPIFIFCLVLLILNDFLLKATFHNVFTGKLSDFCGLFIFPIFWCALFPKFKSWIFILSGILFIFWKSEYASGLIELVNTFFPLERTVDPTDLLALPVLLLGWLHLKGRPQLALGKSLLPRLATAFIALVTIFSFCATSQQRYVQSFDHPQYVLLRSALTPDVKLYDEFEFYKIGSLLVVKVNHQYISRPVLDDDFNKNRSLEDLDANTMARIGDSTSLMPPGKITVLTIETPQGRDALRFKGGRLDGRFTRTKNGKLMIEGFYKMGIEDSIWTFKDSTSNAVIKQTIVNGERTSVEQFRDGKLVSSTSINTRADSIRNIYIKIGMLALCMVGIILFLRRNYLKTFPEQLTLKMGWKWLLCLLSPIFVWLSYLGLNILLINYSPDIFETLATIIFIFMATCPLMFVAVFKIRLRKEIDIVLYCLLFGLACSIWTICGTLIELAN
ncbi:hypothetical protein IM793_12560 [Pedobacter sp. MR2016-19]|uniref:toxin-antitoxin system YwqK family antitoxin n=1 Tax=Pedobacter sp. MR2016-19 TaxID=2780089 RepID=UPI001876C1EB|nr:hypothetical protein [Pedobacter sp. MR2016-19]MBE5319996.1 hypothetical protein [Pedobacter sp. MR2016-19]